MIYADMDAFYLSCELTRRPELRGKPAIVAHDAKEGRGRGVILSASYEARACGFRSAMPVRLAWQKREEVEWIPPDFGFYQKVSDEVMGYLRDLSPTTRVFSIDEAALKATGLNQDAVKTQALELQKEIYQRFSIPCSIGIAPSLTLAKMASDAAKPGGIRVVGVEELPRFLTGLPVRKVPGIGPVSERALQSLGVRTIGDAATVTESRLRTVLGDLAATLHGLSEGRVPEEDWPEDLPTRSLGQMFTFEEDVADLHQALDEIDRLAGEVHQNLRVMGFRFRTVTVQVRWEDLEGAQRSRSFRLPTDAAEGLQRAARALLTDLWETEERQGRRVRTIGVSAHELRPVDPRQSRLEV